MRKPAYVGVPRDLSATAYILTQNNLIDDLESAYDENQGFQVGIEVVEKITGLDFGDLRDADYLASPSEHETFIKGQACADTGCVA